MRISPFLILSLLCLCTQASAAVSGRARVEEQVFVEKQNANVQRAETGALIEFEERESFAETWKLRFEPRVRFSSLKHAADVPVDGDFRDSLIEKKIGSSTRVQAGSFIKTWEGTDGLNPMDIATVRSYRDPLNAESLGSIGVAASGTFGEGFNWDALYVPWQTPARLPGNSSAWWPQRIRLPLEADGWQLLLPGAPEYEIQHHETLNRALNDNYGGRLQYHVESWDFSLGYFEGAAQLPVLQPIINGVLISAVPGRSVVQMTNPLLIRPVEYRRRTIAFGAVHSGEGWIFRLAGRHDQPLGDSKLLPGWSDQLVGGVERTLNAGAQQLTLVLQLAYENKARAKETVLDSPDPFERAVLLGMRLPYSDDLLFYVSGLIDVYKNSSLARVNVQRKFGAHWLGELTAEWLRGGDESLLGQWRNQSRGIVSATYRF